MALELHQPDAIAYTNVDQRPMYACDACGQTITDLTGTLYAFDTNETPPRLYIVHDPHQTELPAPIQALLLPWVPV